MLFLLIAGGSLREKLGVIFRCLVSNLGPFLYVLAMKTSISSRTQKNSWDSTKLNHGSSDFESHVIFYVRKGKSLPRSRWIIKHHILWRIKCMLVLFCITNVAIFRCWWREPSFEGMFLSEFRGQTVNASRTWMTISGTATLSPSVLTFGNKTMVFQSPKVEKHSASEPQKNPR